MLCVEIEFLTRVSVAATPNRRDEAEWPPHPDRLFQALVAAWGRNDPPDEEERRALEWIEALDSDGLVISAPAAYPRDVVTTFVPPNDAHTTGKVGDSPPAVLAPQLRVIPDFRKNRQPRAFPAVLPQATSPVVRYVWSHVPDIDAHRDALARLAREVTYIGHSHSLVRAAVVEGVEPRSDDDAWMASEGTHLRMPYRGRLKYLRDCYSRSQASSRIIRPVPSVVTRVLRPKRGSPAPSTLFDGDNVTVLSDGGGFVPSLDAFPLVAKRLRDALLKTAKEMGLPIPTVLSGHDADGSPTNEQHIAILPLADVGWRYSQSRLMGVALVWPRDVEPGQRREALRILASFMREGPSETGLLHFGRRGCWQLTLAPDPDRASLRFERYTRGARCWGTVLPAVLDRHPKDRSGEELAAIVARACINIGLPPQTIDGLNVEASEHAAIKGAPSTTDIRNALSKDSRFRNKPLRHLILTFPRPVRGPLILGAGRFRGLGLCLTLDDRVRS